MVRFTFLLFLPALVFAQSATSQPSRPKVAGVNCTETKSNYGFEAHCNVETENTTWEIGYSVEGKEKKDWFGKLTNGVLIFHPRGNNFRVHEYWDNLVGPGKSIDTNKWRVVSLGTLGDGKPKQGSPIFLSSDEMVKVQTKLFDYLYPESETILGGGSDGGRLAILWSIANPKRVKKLFLTGTHGYVQEIDNKMTDFIEESLAKLEKEKGPFAFWQDSAKLDWWKGVSQLYVNVAYTEEYFKKPEPFRDETVTTWATYFRDSIDPHWFSAQIRALQNGFGSLSDAAFSALPKQIFFALNPRDQFAVPSLQQKFVDALTKQGHNVKTALIQDIRGHVACCEGEIPKDMNSGLKAFLER